MMRIWCISNPPNDEFKYLVDSPEEAAKILEVLDLYNLYLGKDIIKANRCGIEIFNESKSQWERWKSK